MSENCAYRLIKDSWIVVKKKQVLLENRGLYGAYNSFLTVGRGSKKWGDPPLGPAVAGKTVKLGLRGLR
jgi:hypothetical protein